MTQMGEYNHLLVGPIFGANAYSSTAFLPDGGKLGGHIRREVSVLRERFIKLCQQEGVEVVNTAFGEDFPEAEVTLEVR